MKKGYGIGFSALVLCLTGISAAECSGGMVLAENGKARMCVVADAAEMNRIYPAVYPCKLFETAVNDFKKHLSLATGGDFSAGGEHAGGRILLGRAALTTDGLRKEAAALPYGAYVIRSRGKDLLIFGGEMTGTVNGMYAFLRDGLGIEFMGADERFHIIPERGNVILDDWNETKVPSYRYRDFSGYYTPGNEGYLWGVRMGNFVLNNQNNFSANHSFYRLFPGSRYAKEHPEYYALSGGVRKVPADSRDMNWQVCLSNPEVAAIALNAAKNYFRGDRLRRVFELVPNDNYSFCRCDGCRALQPVRPESNDCFTDVYTAFASRIAAEIAKEFPDRFIGIIAYAATERFPLKKIAPNLFVVFSPDHSQFYDPVYRERELKNLRGWREKSAKENPCGWHAYTSLCSIAPRYYPHSFAETLKKMYSEYNVISFLGDGCAAFWPWAGPQNYLIARLLWDTSLDVEELLNHYFVSLYGPAAREIRAFYDLLEKRYAAPRSGGVWLKDHNTLSAFEIYSAEDAAALREHLRKAGKAAAGREKIAARVRFLTEKMDVVLKMMEVFQLAGRNAEAPDAAELAYCVSVMNRVEAEWRKRILAEPSLGVYAFQNSRPGFDYTELVRKLWHLDVGAKIADGIAKLSKMQGSDSVRALRRSFETDALRRAMLGLASGGYRCGENLLRNPGFEDVGSEFPRGVDWISSGARNWAAWHASSSTASGISGEWSCSGGKAAFLQGKGGCLISSPAALDLSDGRRIFHAEVSVRRSSENGIVKIRMVWYDRNGNMLFPIESESRPARKTGEWERLAVTGEAPEKAASCSLFLSAETLHGSRVWFDEASFRKVAPEKNAGAVPVRGTAD